MAGLADQIHAQVEAAVRQGIDNALNNEVEDLVVATFLKHAKSDIYDAFDPTEYPRRSSYTHDDVYVSSRPSPTSLRVEPHVETSPYPEYDSWAINNHSDLTPIIEAGGPYTWTHKPPARPFVENTQKEVDAMGGRIATMITALVQASLNF